MKRIAMVCVKESTGRLLAGQLAGVLGEGARVDLVSTETAPLPSQLQADLILLTSRPLASEVNRRVSPGTPILHTNRTLWRRDWQSLMALPNRTRVLMVHETLETAHNALTLLYELGVKHLELLPYAPGQSLPGPVDLAVTNGHPHLVPQGAPRVHDIGPRPLDPLTILDVMSRLDLLTEESSLRLQGWMGKTMTRSHGLTATITWLGELKRQIEAVLDISGDAMIACDATGRITVFNQRAEELTGCRAADAAGRPVRELLPQIPLEEALSGRSPLPNQVVEVDGSPLAVTCVPMRRNGHLVGAVAICRPVGESPVPALAAETVARGHTARYTFADIVGVSQPLQEVLSLARQVTRSDSTVLISGETGTGKEVLAQAIHNASPRRHAPFVAVNCAALPDSLLESELFGYEEGSFTGAARGGRRGLFEQAHRGTIFLDEIGDIAPSVQVRLLRVLQERQVMRVGGSRVVPVDVRVIAATNRDLLRMVSESAFRADLYYRLNVLPLVLPPLRQRPDDIPVLVRHFLQAQGYHRPLAPDVMAALVRFPWPGNLRELRNCVEYMVTVAGPGPIGMPHLPAQVKGGGAAGSAPAVSAPSGVASLAEVDPLILQEVHHATLAGQKVGRGSLVDALAARGHRLTEADVRARLARLCAAGLLTAGKGRQGTRLTDTGLAALHERAHL